MLPFKATTRAAAAVVAWQHDLNVKELIFDKTLNLVSTKRMDDSTDTSYITDDEDLKLSSLEYQALQLYDQLLQITLEYYYLESLNESPQVVDDTSMVSTEDLDAARVELLYAKALYTLRNNMEESMIVANPMIQSVHGGKPNSIDRCVPIRCRFFTF